MQVPSLLGTLTEAAKASGAHFKAGGGDRGGTPSAHALLAGGSGRWGERLAAVANEHLAPLGKSLSTKRKRPQPRRAGESRVCVGQRCRAHFPGHGWFNVGTVSGTKPGSGVGTDDWWAITFDDGDAGDYSETSVCTMNAGYKARKARWHVKRLDDDDDDEGIVY